jgi:acetyl-CoA carboxylase biotin carboxyl carrier protein
VLTFEQIKELIELVARHRLSGVEVERSGFRLKIDGVETLAAAAAAPALERGAAGAGTASAAAAQGLPAAVALSGLPVHAGELGAAPPAGTLAAAQGAQGMPGSPSASGKPRPHILNSPIVGTFYRSPSPDAPPFTEVGARVRKGQALCIIEAMKLMNEIESDVDGTVVEVYPQNAQAVEFGEPLFAIEVS